MVKEPAETKYDIDMRQNLHANVELQNVWYACVGGTTGPDGLPEYLGKKLTGGPVSERQGLEHDEGTANLDEVSDEDGSPSRSMSTQHVGCREKEWAVVF